MANNDQHQATIALMQAGQWQEAEKSLANALVSQPDDSQALRLLGTVCHLTQRPGEAIDFLQQSLALDAKNTSTLLNLGSVHMALAQTESALRYFTEVTQLAPEIAVGHFNLALACQQAGKLADAERHLQVALSQEPNAIDIALNLADLHYRAGQFERCMTEAEAILSRDGLNLQAHLLRVKSCIALEQLSKADEAFAAIPTQLRQDSKVCATQGQLHALNGRLEQATAAYRKAISGGDSRIPIALALARCLIDSGETGAAVETLKSIIQRAPDIAEYHALLGLALHDLGNIQAALDAYDQALKIEANSAHYLTAKASLLFKLQHDSQAEEAIEAAISSAPAVVSSHLLRVERCIANEDYSAALQACERYLERVGAECNLLAAKAFLLHALRRTAEATEILDYDGLLKSWVIDTPPGYASVAEFNMALVEQIHAHPSLSMHNAASKATQHGRQSGNLLFDRQGPFADFETMLWQSAKRYLVELKRRPQHPFSALPPQLHAVHCWAVVLERSGYQTPHIHPRAWLSGVYYPQLPALVQNNNNDQQGWIEFGAPPPELVMQPSTPTHRIRPQEGLMVLFPSYFYHRTLPYESDEQRISMAFDFSARHFAN